MFNRESKLLQDRQQQEAARHAITGRLVGLSVEECRTEALENYAKAELSMEGGTSATDREFAIVQFERANFLASLAILKTMEDAQPQE